MGRAIVLLLAYMTDTKTQIAHNLQTLFVQQGFSEPGVDALKQAAGVSLRTLYKYFPSREHMVVGALEYRNDRYLRWISGGPECGPEGVAYVFERLGAWLKCGPNHGCLLLNAAATYPDSAAVRETVRQHKLNVRGHFRQRLHTWLPKAQVAEISAALLIIHEGQTDSARTISIDAATQAALRLSQALLTPFKETQ